MLKLIITIFILLSFQKGMAIDPFIFGKCIQDPNAALLQNKWKEYHSARVKRAKVNVSVLVEKIRMDDETMKILQAISEVENLINHLDQLENKFLRKAFIDTRFNDLISSTDFIDKLENKIVDQEIKDSKLPFKDDPQFYSLLDEVRVEIKRPEIKQALQLFREYDLGVLQNEYRKSAKSALRLIRKRGATLEAVRKWKSDPPYLRNLPLPSVKLGPFVVVYRSLLIKSIANFALERKITLNEARKLFPKIKQVEVDNLNNATAPVDSNAYDENIVHNKEKELAAIDGVARTLWGEASSCEMQGLSQFEAIGRIIADRSIAVCSAIDEQKELGKKFEEVREKNWTTFLSNWAGIKRPAPGMQNKPYAKLKGLSDFGRKEKIDIPCAAQVVSKKNQFSVWNSYSIKKYHTGQFHKNIPDAVYEIQGPQAENDDKALVRILCPEFQSESQKNLWKKAVEISSQIVRDPKKLITDFKWPVDGEILFYTHDASLPFAKEVKVKHLIVNGNVSTLRKKGTGACNKFRLFIPKNKNLYFN
jgi:hypothetical protein